MKRELIFKLLFGLAIGLLVAFCFRINPDKAYGWWGGMWQGCLGIYHGMLSLFNDEILVRAPNRTLGYDIWWWMTLLANAGAVLLILIRLIIPIKNKR